MDYEMDELLPIVSELAQKYTGYESTSITYEKAQSLMGAVLYCLEEYRNSCANSLVDKNVTVKEKYHIGANLILEKVNSIREIFNAVSIQFDNFGVKCLYDTVQKGIPQFLKWYDIKFCPQDTILTLDYPLLIDCSSLTGADAVYKYIQAIQVEQTFLSLFDRNYVRSVLTNYNSDYRNMSENICGIVLMNTVGHLAVKKSFRDAYFLHEDYFQLSEILKGKSISDIEHIVKNFIEEMVKRYYKDDTDMLDYLCCETNHIATRIYTANQNETLSKVFVL